MLRQFEKLNLDSEDSVHSLNQKFRNAVRKGDIEDIKTCLIYGADINYRVKRGGLTALMIAVVKSYHDVTCLLIDQGCNTEITTRSGNTALMLAVVFRKLTSIKILINKGCYKYRTKNDGSTALHIAVDLGYLDIIQCLIELGGINPIVKNNKGQTPFDLAASKNDLLHKRIMEYLQNTDRYQKKPGQKGLVLIVNFMFSGHKKERLGSEVDVNNLKEFFGVELGYQVQYSSNDMTKYELLRLLQNVESTMLTRNANDYHSFICIVMSHGNEKGISTKDDQIAVEEMTNIFKNKPGGKFVGKPKVFLIQSCRGAGKQEKFEVSDSIAADSQSISSENSEIYEEPLSSEFAMRLPSDADIIVAYATTPGYISIRNERYGSYFIKAFLETATLNYRHIDIEEIFRLVRRTLAVDSEYEPKTGKYALKCQIGIMESTSTKKFFL